MKQQTQLLKFGVTGTPKFTGFQLSNDMSFISWVSAKKDTSHAKVMIKNIVELTFGQRTDKFKRNPRPDLMHLSFSLSHRLEDHPGETDTLDIVCKDEKELQYWTTGLLALIEGRVTLEVIAAVADLPPLAAPTNDEAKSAFQGTNDVFSFGCGSWGQHGLTELHDERSPTIVKSFLGRGVQLIACGWAHSVVMLETGQLAAYGDRVGTGLEKDSLLPTIIQLPPASRATITQIACGAFHSALVTDRGELLTWGCNLNGQLGLGHNFDVATPTALPASAFGDNSVQAVYCGANTTAAVSANGDLYTWGAGESGALGHNDKQDRWSPVPVQDLVGQRIAKVACGEAHMIAYSDDKETFSWGWNACGQLGLGHCDDVLRPSPIEVFRGQEVLELAAGAAHSVALVMIPKMNIRQAFVFGANNCGQLGLPEKKSHSKPSVVPPVSTEEISTIACGAHHTVLHSSGTLFQCNLDSVMLLLVF
jgi:alpha-tubulin suppressor-like RCC1 family protein